MSNEFRQVDLMIGDVRRRRGDMEYRVRNYMNGAGSRERGNCMLRRLSAALSRRCLLQR